MYHGQSRGTGQGGDHLKCDRSGISARVDVYTAPGMKAHLRLAFVKLAFSRFSVL